jgi:ATP-binding cassette subfamily B protein
MNTSELATVEAGRVSCRRGKKPKVRLRPPKRSADEGAPKRSKLGRSGEAIREIVRANTLTARALWDAQPRATIARVVVGVSAVMAPLLSWYGNGLMVDAIARTRSVEDIVLGAAALIVSLALLGVIPVALSSLERMSDNCTFEVVFGKFTRKMVSFTQEQLSDPVLAESFKQVKERAVWRMMTMARTQPQVIRTVGTLLMTGGIVAYKAPLLLVIVVVFAIPSMVVELAHARRRCDLDEELAPVWGPLWTDLYNLMVAPALAMLHQFGAALWFAARYRQGLAAASAQECNLETAAALKRVLAAVLVGVGLGASIVLLVSRALTRELTAGELVLILGTISSFAACLSELASLLGQQWSQARSIKDMVDFLEHPYTPSVTTRRLSIEREYGMTAVHGEAAEFNLRERGVELTFDDVWYRYPSAGKEHFAVRGISFCIGRGSVVAVVGPNGAGKSSTMALMLRQLRATSGRILLDGKPIDSMSAEEFAGQVVMLPQQLRHFNLTLRELLNLGRSTRPVSDEVLWRELSRIGAADFVRKWGNGLDTPLGLDRRNAIEPSGGQLQRLLLAAVVIADRGLIVLDEPVSAVDPEAAKRFWDALFEETTNRTVIFSTHHLGAVRRADMILFVEGGQIAAQGTHDELIERSEQYRNLFEAQANEYR